MKVLCKLRSFVRATKLCIKDATHRGIGIRGKAAMAGSLPIASLLSPSLTAQQCQSYEYEPPHSPSFAHHRDHKWFMGFFSAEPE